MILMAAIALTAVVLLAVAVARRRWRRRSLELTPLRVRLQRL